MKITATHPAPKPFACPECLRRGHLLGQLAPYLEKAAIDRSGAPVYDLLCLENEDLVRSVAADVAERVLGEVGAMAESDLSDRIEVAGCWACCRHDPLYPESLWEAADAPWCLYGRGDPTLLVDLAEKSTVVTIAGARRATSYGREVARSLGRDLAAAGMTVVSGMAFGIDACAHRGALEAGRTIAVLGCGADVAYPASHRSLWRRIQENGLVVSELPPGTGAWRWSFPARNRIMAAIAGTTVMVEAAERSGSLSTAEIAADLGRKVGAVPGAVNSRVSGGTNGLLSKGAYVVRSSQDVLDAMVGTGAKSGSRDGLDSDVDGGSCDETDASEYVDIAMQERLKTLKTLHMVIENEGRNVAEPDIVAAELGIDPNDLDGDGRDLVEVAETALYEQPLYVETTTIYEIVFGTGGPDDRLIVECNVIPPDPGGVHGSHVATNKFRRIVYRYSWSGSAEVELIGEDRDTAEAFARQVVPELVE
jgi:DNA processing protein